MNARIKKKKAKQKRLMQERIVKSFEERQAIFRPRLQHFFSSFNQPTPLQKIIEVGGLIPIENDKA